jgi:hypothetical protein
MARKKITLGYIKNKLKKDGIDSLTPTEANALSTYKKLGQFGGKKKEEDSTPKIKVISDSVQLADGMEEVRSNLDTVDKFIWDKAMEGLSTTKATGKWPDFMTTITDLGNKVKVASEGSEIELDWDIAATSEALD